MFESRDTKTLLAYVWLRQILSHVANECRVPEYKNQWFDVLRRYAL